MTVVGVGFGNYVCRGRVVAILTSDSSPIKRAIQDARKNGSLIDATQGRRTRSVLFLDDGRVLLSGLGAETLARRMDGAASEAADADLG